MDMVIEWWYGSSRVNIGFLNKFPAHEVYDEIPQRNFKLKNKIQQAQPSNTQMQLKFKTSDNLYINRQKINEAHWPA